MKIQTGYKLFRQRADGSLGSLFINKKQRIPIGVWLKAENHPTKGYAHRPGWHATYKPIAPHLRQTGDRIWCKIQIKNFKTYKRPNNQGGTWILAKYIKIVEICNI